MIKPRFELLDDNNFISCYENANSYSEFYCNLGYSSSDSINSNVRSKIKLRMKLLNLSENKFNPTSAIGFKQAYLNIRHSPYLD